MTKNDKLLTFIVFLKLINPKMSKIWSKIGSKQCILRSQKDDIWKVAKDPLTLRDQAYTGKILTLKIKIGF